MKEFAVNHSIAGNANLCSDERHFLEAITRWNYFPNQKSVASELPPNITTRRFTPEVARQLIKEAPISKPRNKVGFDLVEYRATRYNNVSRILGLIHPRAFAKIFGVIEENYEEIKKSTADSNSAINLQRHDDGRILIMNYEDPETKALAAAQDSFGKKYRAHTDVANCFGSIYTHSLEWAAQGFEEVKANMLANVKKIHWSGALDECLRFAKRKETSGLPIGPASSSIALEIILSAVDNKIRDRFSFIRYIDDYTALCDEYAEAQDFIRCLSKELSQYKLTLNLAKTSIVELPMPIQEAWVSDLINLLPPLLDEEGQISYLNSREAFHFLDHAVRLNNATPDGSILKFAVSSISMRVKGRTASDVFHYVLNLSWHYPILLPYLEKIDLPSDHYDKDDLIEKLNEIILVNCVHRRSDGICWSLYYLGRLGGRPTEKSVESIIDSKDCVALAMLCNLRLATNKVLDYAATLLGSPLYTLDENWLFLYELYRQGEIQNPYDDDNTFPILKKYDVDFFCEMEDLSLAEKYTIHVISNPFMTEEEKPKFDDWMKNK